LWPARPSDPPALGRGRSSAEPTARRSGMAQTTPPVSKARKRVAHSHRSTQGGGCRAGERAQRVGVSRRGLRPQEAGAARWQRRLSRRADRRRQRPYAPRRYGTDGHDATTPQRTGGQRQRSGALSTRAGENRSHQGTNCRRSCGLRILPAGGAGGGAQRGTGSPGAGSTGRQVRPECRRRGGRSSLVGAERRWPLLQRGGPRRASGRGLEPPAPRGRAAVPCGMLTHTREGEAHRDHTPGGGRRRREEAQSPPRRLG